MIALRSFWSISELRSPGRAPTLNPVLRVTNRAAFDEIDVTPQQRFRFCQQPQIGVARSENDICSNSTSKSMSLDRSSKSSPRRRAEDVETSNAIFLAQRHQLLTPDRQHRGHRGHLSDLGLMICRSDNTWTPRHMMGTSAHSAASQARSRRQSRSPPGAQPTSRPKPGEGRATPGAGRARHFSRTLGSVASELPMEPPGFLLHAEGRAAI